MQRMSLRRTFLNYITLIKLNYSVFGKTMENITNHKDMNLVTNEQKYQKYVMKPNFKDGYPAYRLHQPFASRIHLPAILAIRATKFNVVFSML